MKTRSGKRKYSNQIQEPTFDTVFPKRAIIDMSIDLAGPPWVWEYVS